MRAAPERESAGPTRRAFLRCAAALAPLAVAPGLVEAADTAAPPAGPHLGFSLYGMKGVPLADALATCAAIGYRNVELALMAGYPTEPKAFDAAARADLRARLKDLRIGVSALMANLNLAADDAGHARDLAMLREAVRLARDLAPDAPPPVETVGGGKPDDWDAAKDRMAARLRGWAEVAAAEGIVVAVKAHAGHAVNTPARLLWLLEQAGSPAIRVAYDHSHFDVQGIPPAESMAALLPHTRFVHIKDAVREDGKVRFLLPGEGRTDYAAYFRLLRGHGYAGPAVVEVSSQIFNRPGYEPAAAARSCHAALAAALAKA